MADLFPLDRLKEIGKPQKIHSWTKFDFPGRGKTYSSMKWNSEHFNGVDWDQRSQFKGIYRFKNKSWAYEVDEELGNYDYL